MNNKKNTALKKKDKSTNIIKKTLASLSNEEIEPLPNSDLLLSVFDIGVGNFCLINKNKVLIIIFSGLSELGSYYYISWEIQKMIKDLELNEAIIYIPTETREKIYKIFQTCEHLTKITFSENSILNQEYNNYNKQEIEYKATIEKINKQRPINKTSDEVDKIRRYNLSKILKVNNISLNEFSKIYNLPYSGLYNASTKQKFNDKIANSLVSALNISINEFDSIDYVPPIIDEVSKIRKDNLYKLIKTDNTSLNNFAKKYNLNYSQLYKASNSIKFKDEIAESICSALNIDPLLFDKPLESPDKYLKKFILDTSR
jgi:predicted transcriptional regulator